MNPTTFQYRINYKIIDQNGNTIIDDSLLRGKCRYVNLSDNIGYYLNSIIMDDIISNDIIPSGCKLYDLDIDPYHIDHAICRYDIIGKVNNTVNELLLSYLRGYIDVIYDLNSGYRMIITNVDEICDDIKDPGYN